MSLNVSQCLSMSSIRLHSISMKSNTFFSLLLSLFSSRSLFLSIAANDISFLFFFYYLFLTIYMSLRLNSFSRLSLSKLENKIIRNSKHQCCSCATRSVPLFSVYAPEFNAILFALFSILSFISYSDSFIHFILRLLPQMGNEYFVGRGQGLDISFIINRKC